MRIKERLFEDVYSRLDWYTVKIRQTYAVHSDVVISQKTGWLYEGRGGEGKEGSKISTRAKAAANNLSSCLLVWLHCWFNGWFIFS